MQVCSSKISCISWSSFHQSTLASSDYEGTVIVWDTATNTKATVWQEHEKRSGQHYRVFQNIL